MGPLGFDAQTGSSSTRRIRHGVGCLNDDQTTVAITYCHRLECGDGVCTRPYENVQICPQDCPCPAGQTDCCGDGLCHPFIVCDRIGC
jgi:hypothetical protein